MKSVFMSFLMFIVVFGLLKLGILNIFDNKYFTPVVYISLIVVFICALYFVGTPKLDDFKKIFETKKEKNDDEE